VCIEDGRWNSLFMSTATPSTPQVFGFLAKRFMYAMRFYVGSSRIEMQIGLLKMQLLKSSEIC